MINDGLLTFLRASPTPYHAVKAMTLELVAAGYHELREGDAWKLTAGGKYFVTRNGSAIVAFRLGAGALENGFRLAGGHTDSPCLKVKPNPDLVSAGYLKVGVEVYGSVLLAPWFDRDLSLAGRVSYRGADGKLASALVDFKRPIAVIPNLAIHLQRDVNEGRPINKQIELPPILCQLRSRNENGFADALREVLPKEAAEVLGWDLSFYDVQPASLVGLKNEFIASARLDNLFSCYVGLRALVDAEAGPATAVFLANDHEEVGSATTSGAEGPFVRSVLERIVGVGEPFYRAIDRSWFVSTDNAHGIHPNYAERHEPNHGPLLNGGPVIKINANQRYASNADTVAAFAHCAAKAEVPVQRFVVRSDMGCGSTIGPITATNLGVRTVDIGVPTFAMHSIRELAGARDADYLHRTLKVFFREPL